MPMQVCAKLSRELAAMQIDGSKCLAELRQCAAPSDAVYQLM